MNAIAEMYNEAVWTLKWTREYCAAQETILVNEEKKTAKLKAANKALRGVIDSQHELIVRILESLEEA